MVAKIKRVIVASMLDVDKNTERPVTIHRRNSLTRDVCFTSESGHHCGSSSFGKLFMPLGTAVLTAVKSNLGEPGLGSSCPYRKSNPHVVMVQSAKDGTHLDAPGALNEPSNRRILT